MKLLTNIKPKYFRKSKKGGKSIVKSDVQSPTAAFTTDEGATSSSIPSYVKESTPNVSQNDRESTASTQKESTLRPLKLGSFDFSSSYIFPSLHSEASSMLDMSLLIYVLSELRELGTNASYNIALTSQCSNIASLMTSHISSTSTPARNGVLDDPSKSLRILQMPLPLSTAQDIIRAESDLLNEVLNDGKHDASLSALRCFLKSKKKQVVQQQEAAVEKVEEDGLFSGLMDSWNGCLAGGFSFDEIFCGGDLGIVDNGKHIEMERDKSDSSMIYTVGDVKCYEELVYGVEVNPNEERITVVFRGGVTNVDSARDANIQMMRVSEPSSDSEEDNIGIHQGFYEYLMSSSKRGSPSKYEQIMSHVQKLFQDKNRLRHYKLYVTGHGLGGALATIFGYYCAGTSSTNKLPLPITIVSIGSPRVGNIEFARSFTELESQGKLRHLRMVVNKDPIADRPFTTSSAFSSSFDSSAFYASNDASKEKYEHTGMLCKLRDDIPETTSQRCEISYSGAHCLSLKCLSDLEYRQDPAESRSVASSKSVDARAMTSYHFGEAYMQRLSLLDTDTFGLTLNRLYQEEACFQCDE